MNRLGLFARLVTVGLFAAVLFAGIAVALQVCVRLPRAHGAPVPPPPKLSEELLVGKWAYKWGEMDEGTIWLAADGSYAVSLGAGRGIFWHGTWAVRDGVLEMAEWCYDPERQVNGEPVRYRFTADVRAFPRVVFTSTWGARMVFRNPQR